MSKNNLYSTSSDDANLTSVAGAIEAARERGVDTVEEYRQSTADDLDALGYADALIEYLGELVSEDEALTHDNGGAYLDDVGTAHKAKMRILVRQILADHADLPEAAWQHVRTHKICRLCNGDVLFARSVYCTHCLGSGLEPEGIES